MKLLLVALLIASVGGQTVIRDKVKGLPRRDNRGRSESNKFCFTFLRNVADSEEIASDSDSRLGIIVSTWRDEAVDIRISYYPYADDTTADTTNGPTVQVLTRTETVPANGVLVIDDISRFQQVEPSSSTEPTQWFKAIRVETVDPSETVAVYGMSDNFGSADVFVALPYVASEDTTDYYYTAFSTSTDISSEVGAAIRRSHIVLSACNETLAPVSISASVELLDLPSLMVGTAFFGGRFKKRIPLHSDGRIVTTDVPNYGSYVITDEDEDLTGLVALSEHPLGFMTGHECGQIPTLERQCDHLVEQVAPSYTWGYSFLVSPLFGRPAGSLVTVATRYATKFTLTCSSSEVEYSLADYGVVSEIEIGASDYCSIISERPISVMQYAKGFQADTGLDGAISEYGDPFQLSIPPVNQYSNNYVFSTDLELLAADRDGQNFLNGHFLTITVPSDYFQPSSIFVNGSSASSLGLQWNEILCPGSTVCGYSTTCPVGVGTQDVYHNDSTAGIGVATYGWGSEKSYGFTVAYNMDPIGLPIVSLGSDAVEVTEGGNAEIEVIRSGDPGVNITVLLTGTVVAGATNPAEYGLDLESFSISVNFLPGETTKTVSIGTLDDSLVEESEVFQVSLSRLAAGVVLGEPNQAVVTILDDDGAPSVTTVFFDPLEYTVAEPGATVSLVLKSSAELSADTTIQFTFTDGTATITADYTVAQAVVTAVFPAGGSTLSFPVGIVNDAVHEGQETFTVQFAVLGSQSVEADATKQMATVTITDDEDIPVVSFGAASFSFSESDGSASVSLILSGASTSQIVVSLTQTSVTASGNGVDYETVAGASVTFLAGETTKSFSFSIIDDDIVEQEESLTVTITAASSATVGAPSEATVSIQSDDFITFKFSEGTYSVSESDGSISVVLNIEGQSSFAITYNVFTVNSGDAYTAEDDDFTAVSQAFTFPANQLNGMETIDITVTQNDLVEMTETFGVDFTITSGSEFVQTENKPATVSILDSDVVTIGFGAASYTVTEGAAEVELSLEKSGLTEFNVTVAFITTVQTATAADSSCIGSMTNEAGTWSAAYKVSGERATFDILAATTGWVGIGFSDDAMMPQSDVIVGAVSSDGTMSYVSDRYATARAAPGVDSSQDIEMTSALESGGATVISFSRLFHTSDSADLPLNSSYVLWAFGGAEASFDPTSATSIGYHGSMTRGAITSALPSSSSLCAGDYISVSQVITFAPDDTSKVISIPLNDDATYEISESFLGSITLVSDSSQASLTRDSTQVFITDDSDDPDLSVEQTSYTISEAATYVTVCVELSNPAKEEISYSITHAPGTALEGEDYAGDSIPASLTFAPLTTRRCFNITIVNDGVTERQEQFSVSFQREGRVSADATAQIIITNDDVVTFQFGQSSYTFAESDGTAEVTLVIGGQSAFNIDYTVSTVISATDTAEVEDFTAVSSAFVFPAGQAGETRTISITLTQNDGEELSETFGVTFDITSESAFVQEGPKPASVTILDSDVLAISFRRNLYEVDEGAGTLEVCVMQSVLSSVDTIIVLENVPGQASSDDDYLASSIPSSVTIPTGMLARCFNVVIVDDLVNERDEGFQITATLQGDATVTATTGVTILDNDQLSVSFKDSSYSVREDEGPVTVCVVLNTVSSEDVTVLLASANGSAVDVSDFEASSIPQSLPIAAGSTEQCFNVTIVDDAIHELSELFTISVQIQGSSVDPVPVQVTIEDDDDVTFGFQQPAYTVSESDGSVTVCLELEPASAETISAFVAASDISAQDNLDYRGEDIPLTPIVFNPGDVLKCVDIGIIDDNVVEPPESFLVVVVATQIGVQSSAQVNILDDDALGLRFKEQAYTVSEDQRNVTICIQLTNIALEDTIVFLDDISGSAVEGDDYAAISIPSSITIPAGGTEECFVVEIVDDEVHEITELFQITARFEDSAATDATTDVTITDDDEVGVVFEFRGYTVAENAGTLEVCIELGRISSQTLTAQIFSTDGSATQVDYNASSIPQTVTFAPGVSKQCFDVEILDDNIVEGSEMFTISVVLQGSLETPTDAHITIEDDDELSISFKQATYSVGEGDTAVTVCVVLGAVSTDDVTVLLGDVPGTALQGEDYDNDSIPVFIDIPPFATEGCFDVDIVNDNVNEPLQSFQLTAEIDGSSAPIAMTIVNINDDDGISVGFGQTQYTVSENGTSVQVCVVLSKASMDTITVELALLDGSSATADDDYRGDSIPQEVMFTPGMVEMCFDLDIVDDDTVEPPETVVIGVRLQGSSDYSPSTQVTILDNDAVSVSFKDSSYTVTEQNGQLMVCLMLDLVSSEDTTILLEAVPGSASPGTEYVESSIPSSVVISAVMTEGCFDVTLLDDDIDEPQEQFTIVARLPGSTTIIATTTVIINDDEDLTISFKEPLSYIVNEQDEMLTVCLQLSVASSQNTTISLSSLPGSASQGEDYDASTIPTSIVVVAGQTESCFVVDIVNDDVNEPVQESFDISAQILGGSASVSVIIVDNDDISISFKDSPYSVNENDGSVEVCVLLSVSSTQTVTLELESSEGTATAGSDYNASSIPATLTFPPGSTEQCIDVKVVDDDVDEPSETFTITVRRQGGVGGAETTQVTIEDGDDLLVEFVQPIYDVMESAGTVTVCVELNVISTADTTVTLDDSPVSATAGMDYDETSIPASIVIPAGEKRRCFNVSIIDDDENELQEEFRVTARLPGSMMDDATASVFINDNDGLSVFFQSSMYVVNETEGTRKVCVVLSTTSSETVTVELESSEGSATAVSDYNASSIPATLTFPPGTTEQCFYVEVVADDINELSETFDISVRLQGSSDVSATTEIIIRDSNALSISFSQVNYVVTETVGMVNVCVVLNVVASRDIMITLSSVEGTASRGSDYVESSVPSSVVVPAGGKQACFNVQIIDDDLNELQEGFQITARLPGSTAPDATAGVLINDNDDYAVSFKDPVYTVNEDGGSVQVCVVLSAPSSQSVTVEISGVDGSATAGGDYDASDIPMTLTFVAGSTEECFDVDIINDTINELSEQFTITVRPEGSSDLPASTTVTIEDDDALTVRFKQTAYDVNEGDGSVTICVEIEPASSESVSVFVSVASGNATEGLDYSGFPMIPVVIEPGTTMECLEIAIIDDRVIEGPESIVVNAGNDRDTTITSTVINIEDNDATTISGPPEEVFNEKSGTVKICVGFEDKTLVAGYPVEIELEFTTGTATEPDFSVQSSTVVIEVGENEACADVDIQDDDQPEGQETFFVQTNVVGDLPGIVPEDEEPVMLIISDETVNVTECVVRSPLVVAPNRLTGQTGSPAYNFKGTCEHVLSTRCGSQGYDVVVDFLQMDFSMGRVGLRIPSADYNAIIEEDLNLVEEGTRPSSVTVSTSHNQTEIVLSNEMNELIVSIVRTADRIVILSAANGEQLCGLCGSVNGSLIGSDGVRVTDVMDRMQVETFSSSWLVEPSEQILRDDRRECAVIMSDTLIGDPLLQAPLWIQNEDVTRSLCYEVHGRSGAYFNLVSDECVLVNALYTAIGSDLNVVSEMGIDAVGEGEGVCVAIKIRQVNDTCETTVILDGIELPLDMGEATELHGVSVRQQNKYRVRISVPNCDQVSLVMWATCEVIDGMEMMRFNISRGVNLRPTSHGLLGQFWNIPVEAVKIEDEALLTQLPEDYDQDQIYLVTVKPEDSPQRTFMGELFDRHWDSYRSPCLYVGDSQAGSAGVLDGYTDSVIEGRYSDYIVDSVFDHEFTYSKFDREKCSPPPE